MKHSARNPLDGVLCRLCARSSASSARDPPESVLCGLRARICRMASLRSPREILCELRARSSLQPADEQLALVHHFRRQVIVELDEELLVLDHFAAPPRGIDALQLVEVILRQIEPAPVEVLVA